MPNLISKNKNPEIQKIRERYARRNQFSKPSLYNPLNPSIYMRQQEKERAIIRWINEAGLQPVQDKRVLEVGCGSGDNLLQLIRLGFQPGNLVGNDLLEKRALQAKYLLPIATQMLIGDFLTLTLEKNSFDVVLQSTVFTSILDDTFQRRLANRMWEVVKQGGGILWYDFIFNNPKNPDVRGIPVQRIHDLFPKGKMKLWRITLAPPISHWVTKIHPSFYTFFNYFPFLRTHVLCWIKKN